MTRRRLPYGTTATLADAVLFDAEVAIDVQQNRLIIGDGVTPGGVPQARKSEVDTKADRNLGNLTSAGAGRAALALGDSATRNVGLAGGTVADGLALKTLQDQVTVVAAVAGSTKVFATRALMAAAAATLNTRAEVRADPAGDVVNGNGVYGGDGAAWVWLSPLLPGALRVELDAMIRADTADPRPSVGESWLMDAAGNRLLIGPSGLHYDPAAQAIITDGLWVQASDDATAPLWVEDVAGNRSFVGDATTTDVAGGASEALWSSEQYQWADERGAVEAARLNAFEMAAIARIANGANLAITTGQSFAAASDNARLNLTAARILEFELKFDARSVGPDSRCVLQGATYVCFGGDSRVLTPLAEHMIGPTNSDLIYTTGQVAIGDYPNNARGGTPETIREFAYQWMRRDWLNQTQSAADAAFFTVAMNHAKTDGPISEVALGDGLSRMQGLIAIFASATGATAKNCHLIDMNHGEADESLGLVDYTTKVQAFDNAIWAAIQSNWGQAARPMFLMHQVGGPQYGSAAMIVANQQVDMMLDGAGANANKVLASVKYEVPSFYGVSAPHPNAGDAHPTMVGNALMGIRASIAAHYCQDRGEYWWLPFPYEVYFKDNRWLLVMPNKFPPLQEAEMVKGCELVFLKSLGVSFETTGGADNPVIKARVVPGYRYLIEGECSDAISGSPTVKTGKRMLPNHAGLTNIRDSFHLDLPLRMRFTRNQTIYATQYHDDPQSNGLGRYLEDIPGWRDDLNLGNPAVRRTITAQPMPE